MKIYDAMFDDRQAELFKNELEENARRWAAIKAQKLGECKLSDGTLTQKTVDEDLQRSMADAIDVDIQEKTHSDEPTLEQIEMLIADIDV